MSRLSRERRRKRLLAAALASYQIVLLSRPRHVSLERPRLPSANAYFEFLFERPDDFKSMCRFDIAETIDLCQQLNLNPEDPHPGRYRYGNLIRYVFNCVASHFDHHRTFIIT